MGIRIKIVVITIIVIITETRNIIIITEIAVIIREIMIGEGEEDQKMIYHRMMRLIRI